MMQDTKENVIGEENEPKGYTDEELQWAAEIAYLHISEEDVRNYNAIHPGEYPSIQWLLTNNTSIEEEYLKKYQSDGDKLNNIESELLEGKQKFIDDIKSGELPCSEWRVSLVYDHNQETGMYGSLLETGDNRAVVAFRGSESYPEKDGRNLQFYLDWLLADFGLLDSPLTDQQADAEAFMREIASFSKQYDSYVTTGHSLGGNLSSHAGITADGWLAERIVACYSFDGPGFSEEYLRAHAEEIEKNGGKVRHYQWSIVGALLHQFENEHYYSVICKDEDDYNGSWKMVLGKHDMYYLTLNAYGFTIKTNMGAFERAVGHASRMIDEGSEGNSELVKDIYEDVDNMSGVEKAFLIFVGLMYYSATGPIRPSLPNWVINPIILLIFDKLALESTILRDHIIPTIIEICSDLGDAYNLIVDLKEEIDLFIKGWNILCDYIDEKWDDSFDDAESAVVRSDPLILDLDGDGFNITTKKNGAHFDLNCDGFAEKMNWNSQDAILAVDLNENGMIDNGREVFGDYHLLADGTRAVNGFEALAQYDTNHDGIIDSRDEIFSKLRLWIDANGNGISEEGELKTLAELGIKAIRLNYESVELATGTEAMIGNMATFVYEDDTEGAIGEMWVASDLFDAIETVITGHQEAVDGLPDVRSYGNVHSLHTAISLDETGTLKALVEQFVSEEDIDKRLSIVEEILHFICDTDEVPEGNRGSFNAKKLAIIEKFMGEGFMGANGANPNSAAAKILENMYTQIVEMYCFAMIGSMETTYLDQIIMLQMKDGTIIFDTTLFNLCLDAALRSGYMSEREFADICAYLGYFGANVYESHEIFYQVRTYFEKVNLDYVPLMDDSVYGAIHGSDGNDTLTGTGGGDILFGKEGNDTLNGGNGNDLLIGGDGNDKLYGGSGDDILEGGAGDDHMEGGAGNDTYIFNRGCGHDTVYDITGTNILKFGEGITVDQVMVRRNNSDPHIRIWLADDPDSSMTFNQFWSRDYSDTLILAFADGKRYNLKDADSPFMNLKGTDEDETIYAIYEGSKIHGNGGDDTLHGSNGDDELYGGEGNDKLYGGSGDDLLDGGAGDDYLDGGAGDDTYIFNRGCGHDTVYDITGTNVLKFGEGITVDQVMVRRSNSDYHIRISLVDDPDSSMTFQEFWSRDYSDTLILAFADGKRYNLKDADSPFMNLKGTDEDETIYTIYDGSRIHGNGGDDILYGSNGDDELYGGEGNDKLYGGSGNDLLEGGAGDDHMEGGAGDDTYIFNRGCGHDTVYDITGTNVLKFGEGITVDQVMVRRSNSDYHIRIWLADDPDSSMTFQEFWRRDYSDTLILAFADGKRYNLKDADSPFMNLVGTDEDETIYTIYDGSRIHGNGGDDTLHGSNGDDELYGGEGNDKLYGGSGNDLLDGGAGDDHMEGGAGNDTYIFNRGCGHDTVYDITGTNVLKFGEGITVDQVMVRRNNSNYDVRIWLADDPDSSMTFQEFWRRDYSDTLILAFADGKRYNLKDADSPFMNLKGTDEDETIYTIYDGSRIYGNGGDDTLYGSNGDDELYGGDGNDKLYGGSGDDLLDGGAGDDYMEGGAGDDTYIFYRGCGHDTVYDIAGTNVLKFGEGITMDDLVIERANGSNDIRISLIDDENSSILFERLAYSDYAERLILAFADGTRRRLSEYQPFSMINEMVSDMDSQTDEAVSALSDILSGADTPDDMAFTETAGDDLLASVINEESLDAVTDVQANLLVQELSGASDEGGIFTSEESRQENTSGLFTEQFILQ